MASAPPPCRSRAKTGMPAVSAACGSLRAPFPKRHATPNDAVSAAVERYPRDRKSTRLNSSHLVISYAVFCLKKKKKQHYATHTVHKVATNHERARTAVMQTDWAHRRTPDDVP